MGQESANYFLKLAAGSESHAVRALRDAGAEPVRSRTDARADLVLRDLHRYWIDLRIHRGPELALEVRIALTNDEWVIRTPLERTLPAVADCIDGPALLRAEDGDVVASLDDERWSLEVEQHYGELRAAFVARVGDYSAPISADHVYAYLHQAGWNRHNNADLARRREREITRMEAMWDPPVAQGEPDGGADGGAEGGGEADAG